MSYKRKNVYVGFQASNTQVKLSFCKNIALVALNKLRSASELIFIVVYFSFIFQYNILLS